MSSSFEDQIAQQLSLLTPEQQQDVLQFAQNIRTQTPKQKRQQALRNLAGSIPAEDIAIMTSAIEADCGRVDTDGW